MSSPAKPIWGVLTKKAERELRQSTSLLNVALSKRSNTKQRQNKLDSLLFEYSNRLNNICDKTHKTTDTANYRQFIVHLQNLRARTAEELMKSELACQKAKRKVVLADQERLKLQRLGERAQKKVVREEKQKESKEIEAQGLSQFNQKSHM
jgi:flagellar export protein FliJ